MKAGSGAAAVTTSTSQSSSPESLSTQEKRAEIFALSSIYTTTGLGVR